MIHWHEGQHLLPEHFQALQNLALTSLAQERSLLHRFSDGLLELELKFDKSTVRVLRLRGILPDGALVTYPGNLELPEREIEGELSRNKDGIDLYVAVPVLIPGMENSLPMGLARGEGVGGEPATEPQVGRENSQRRRLRYTVEEAVLSDENTGGEGRPTYIRKFNGRLHFGTEDTSNLKMISLGRIIPSGGGGLPRLDETACPKLLRLQAWLPLVKHLSKQFVLMEVALKNLLGRVEEQKPGTDGLQLEQTSIRLKIAAVYRHYPTLKALLECDQASPFEVFCHLQSFLGDLAAIQPDKINFVPSAFLHKAPWDQLTRLSEAIVNQLDQEQKIPVLRIPFTYNTNDNLYFAAISTEKLAPNLDRYLYIASGESIAQMDLAVNDRGDFIVAPRERAHRLLFGFTLERCAAPRGLSAQRGNHYFKIEGTAENQEIWAEILQSGGIAIRPPSRKPIEISNIELCIA